MTQFGRQSGLEQRKCWWWILHPHSRNPASAKFQLRAGRSERRSDQMILASSQFKNLSEGFFKATGKTCGIISRVGMNTRRGAFPNEYYHYDK